MIHHNISKPDCILVASFAKCKNVHLVCYCSILVENLQLKFALLVDSVRDMFSAAEYYIILYYIILMYTLC